ncbi:Hsp20/alpha crystallin family protein [Tepidibacillus marianensis]|uniref:Hsp20/alpha crystallin family protein n=1 Tax=Tepidibacillus marianensis TaxID=3131995 RepID=UPI0030CC995D
MPDLSGFFEQAQDQKGNNPKVDILMNQQEIIVMIELLGLNKEEIHLSIHGNQLHVQGQIKNQYAEYTEITRERSYGEFDKIIQSQNL